MRNFNLILVAILGVALMTACGGSKNTVKKGQTRIEEQREEIAFERERIKNEIELAKLKAQEEASLRSIDSQSEDIDLGEGVCYLESQGDKDYFRGLGIGIHINEQSAYSAAQDAAHAEIERNAKGTMKGMTSSWRKTSAGSLASDDVMRIAEGELFKVIDEAVGSAQRSCYRRKKDKNGNYKIYYAVEISKNELVDKMDNALSKNEKLRMEFERKNFREFAAEYIEKLNEKQEY